MLATTTIQSTPFVESKSSTFSKAQAPSVSSGDVRAHLLLLSAFRAVISSLEGGNLKLDPITRQPAPSQITSQFFQAAVWRFHTWVESLPKATSIQAPPVDVLMVWHAYCLNPCKFYADSVSRIPNLTLVDGFPLLEIAKLIDPITLEFKSTREQVELWESQTGCSFDYTDIEGRLRAVAGKLPYNTCPQCNTEIALVDVDERNAAGHVMTTCPSCGLAMTQDAIHVAKFIEALALSQDAKVPLPLTLLNPSGRVDPTRAKIIADEIIRIIGAPTKELGRSLNWSMGRVLELLRAASPTILRKDRLEELLVPYSYLAPFSVDLYRSSLRQASFAFKLNDRGWLDLASEGSPVEALEAAIKKYQQFLDLLSCPGVERLTPSHDVDLVWHTHQLSGAKYRNESLGFLDILLDHDDSPSFIIQEQSKKATDAVWKDHFGVTMWGGDTGPGCSGSSTQDFVGADLVE